MSPIFYLRKNSDAFWQNAFSDYVNTQKNWLENVLELNKEAGFVFIFQHKPFFSTMKNRKAEAKQTRKFWGDIFERHKLKVFFERS